MVDLININCVAVHNISFVVFDIHTYLPTLHYTITVMHTKPIVMFSKDYVQQTVNYNEERVTTYFMYKYQDKEPYADVLKLCNCYVTRKVKKLNRV